MALEYLAWDLDFLEERIHRLENRVERRRLRDAQNPFELPRDEFINLFRLPQEMVLNIADLLRADLRCERIIGLSAEIKVLVALRFYAQGCYQRSVGNQYQLNISQLSTSCCLHAVREAINRKLLRKWIKFPMTDLERQLAKEKFATAPLPFEGVIGAIDCTFVHIIAPSEHEEAFVNHHGRHSLNVQAIVDSDLQILNINPRYPGARNDAFIWSASPIRRAMEHHYNRGERGTWLIDTRQFQYTQQLCKARNVVERFFGVFKSVWRCMSYQRVLMYKPAFSAKIVNACAVLHNMRIRLRLNDDNHAEPIVIDNGHNNIHPIDEDEELRQRGPRALARRIQQQVMQKRFPNYRDAE